MSRLKKKTKSTKSRNEAANRPLAAVVLAAGEGKRMRSATAKVLHAVAGRPLVLHVLDALEKLSPDRRIVITGHQEEAVRSALGDRCEFATSPSSSVQATLFFRLARRCVVLMETFWLSAAMSRC